jgi:DHA1 family bicyclomycin/chloramphenicol resistance-like MFS transporter
VRPVESRGDNFFDSQSRLIGRLLPTLLLVLTVFGPISMDLYLPALPALTAELAAPASLAQLTVTAALIGGLALGQLVATPYSHPHPNQLGKDPRT